MDVSIRIPEGYVFVPKAPGVAAELLEIADAVGADRKLGVRTTVGGYHVVAEVASVYLDDNPEVVPTVRLEPAGADYVAVDVVVGADGIPVLGSAEESAAEEPNGSEVAAELEVPDDSWTVPQIDRWAADQKPPIVFPEKARKADKLALIGEAIQ